MDSPRRQARQEVDQAAYDRDLEGRADPGTLAEGDNATLRHLLPPGLGAAAIDLMVRVIRVEPTETGHHALFDELGLTLDVTFNRSRMAVSERIPAELDQPATYESGYLVGRKAVDDTISNLLDTSNDPTE